MFLLHGVEKSPALGGGPLDLAATLHEFAPAPPNGYHDSMDEAPFHFVPPEQRGEVDWGRVRKVHLLGACGSAMGALGLLLREQGFEVRGSDAGAYPPMSERLAAAGIAVASGYDPRNLDWGPDVVVVGNVIRRDNPEAAAMRERGLAHRSLPEVIGERLIGDRCAVVVAGTHGKTTTTSMIAWLLHEVGRAPGWFVGGVPLDLGRPAAAGTGPEFVVEGDEYDTAYFDKGPKFLHYRPHTAVVTSLEFDHADIYRNIEEIERAFGWLAERTAPSGRLIVCAHAERAVRVVGRAARARVWTYGIDVPADWVARDVEPSAGGMTFTLRGPDGTLGRWRTALTGRHNALNAVAAVAAALSRGVPVDAVRDALARFHGAMRRQQLVGEVGGVSIVDDYAHHPTAVRETIAAIRQRYPGRRLWALFEAESNTSRRRIFQHVYPEALGEADLVVLSKPLKKADRLAPHEQIDVAAIVADLRRRGVEAYHIPEFDDIAYFVSTQARPGDVVLAMSGRDFGGVPHKIVALLRERFEPPPEGG